MSNLTKRVLTSIILVALFVGTTLFNLYSFLLLILVVNLLGLYEFYSLMHSYLPRKFVGLFLSSCLFVSGALFITNICDWKILLINIPISFLLFVSELYRKSENPFLNLSMIFLGIIYLTVPSVFLISMAFLPFKQEKFHPYTIIGFYFIVWASDTGAYFIGKYFGKHLLFARISPKKTWEGSIGGLVSVLLTAFIISLFNTDINVKDWIVIALIVVVTGTFGDFIKSMLKRSLKIKDSGTILPGHGGILDRFDSLLSSSLFVFCYLVLFKN